MKIILYCDIKVVMVLIFNKCKLQILGRKVQDISHHNKIILNGMGMFVIISITRAYHGIIAIGM